MSKFTDIGVEKSGHVTTIEIQRPPLNFFDISLINQIADALTDIDNDPGARAVVLAAQGKAFCAGANFSDPARQEAEAREKSDPASSLGQISHLYIQAVRIFRNKKPIVAAVHGAAIGGGLGLAVSADFRVTCPEARFAANFTKLELASEIAECSPLGLLSTRATMRAGLADRVMAATTHELAEQTRLRATEDFKEGVKATEERRVANFKGR